MKRIEQQGQGHYFEGALTDVTLGALQMNRATFIMLALRYSKPTMPRISGTLIPLGVIVKNIIMLQLLSVAHYL